VNKFKVLVSLTMYKTVHQIGYPGKRQSVPLLFMNNHQPLLVSHRDASYQSIPCSQKTNP